MWAPSFKTDLHGRSNSHLKINWNDCRLFSKGGKFSGLSCLPWGDESQMLM